MRLGLIAPQPVAAFMAPHLRLVCLALRNLLYEDEEKEDALRGLCAVVAAQPQAVLHELHLFLETLLSFHEPPRRLKQDIGQLLTQFKGALGADQWQRATHALPSSLTRALARDYGL